MFDIDFRKKGELVLHTRKFLLYPPYWSERNNQILHNLVWNSVEFNDQNHTLIPEESGLYCFVVCPGYTNFVECKYLFYVGKTNRTLKTRYKEYLYEQEGKGKPRGKVFEMLKMYKDHLYFQYTTLDDSSLIDLYEERLLNTFVPFVNTSIPNALVNSELKNIYEN